MKIENPPGYSPHFVELLPNRVTAQGIRTSLAQRNGTVVEALDLIERALYIQSVYALEETGDGSSVEARGQRWEQKQNDLLTLARELRENPPSFALSAALDPGPPSTEAPVSPPSGALGAVPVKWNGKKPQADIGWLHKTLSEKGMINCSAVDFYGHFVDLEGNAIKPDAESARKSVSPGSADMKKIVAEIRRHES